MARALDHTAGSRQSVASEFDSGAVKPNDGRSAGRAHDVVSIDGEVLATAGQRIGKTLSATEFKPFSLFVQSLYRAGLEQEGHNPVGRYPVQLTCEVQKGPGTKYGVLIVSSGSRRSTCSRRSCGTGSRRSGSREPTALDADIVAFPWHPTIAAPDMVESFEFNGETIALGHRDTDGRSDPFNLIPTKELAAAGSTTVYTGHVHLPQRFVRDGVTVHVVGSMVAAGTR